MCAAKVRSRALKATRCFDQRFFGVFLRVCCIKHGFPAAKGRIFLLKQNEKKVNVQHVFIHCAFFAGNERHRIDPSWRGRINRQIVVLLRQLKHQAHLVYCMSDQLHVILKLSPETPLHELAGRIRENTLQMINGVLQPRGRFYWMPGYAANSISRAEMTEVVRKIRSWDREGCDDFNEAFQDLPVNGPPVPGTENGIK